MNLLKVINSSIKNMTKEQKSWESVAILAGPLEVIEVTVGVASEESGIKMNWGYVGGRAVIHADTKDKDDRAKCRAALSQAILQGNPQKASRFSQWDECGQLNINYFKNKRRIIVE